jgi:hypothetical protein
LPNSVPAILREKDWGLPKTAFKLSFALRRPATYQFAMMARFNEKESPAARSQSSGSDSFPEEPQNNRNNFSYVDVSTKLVAIYLHIKIYDTVGPISTCHDSLVEIAGPAVASFLFCAQSARTARPLRVVFSDPRTSTAGITEKRKLLPQAWWARPDLK